MELLDHSIGSRLAQRDEQAFEQVFKAHFKTLHGYAISIIKDEDEAEEVVQQIFFKLWERAAHLSFAGPVTAYLYRAVHNECLNFIKHEKVKQGHQLHVAYRMKNEAVTDMGRDRNKELEKTICEALDELPEQCRTVFQLSRFEEMKYREIADKLDISVKTVEKHMGKALKLLRSKLVDFLTFFILLFTV